MHQTRGNSILFRQLFSGKPKKFIQMLHHRHLEEAEQPP